MAEEARIRYKKLGTQKLVPENLHNFLEQESPLSMALIDQNERERHLTLHRIQEEQSLKDEYDHRIDELSADYRAKLKDLNETYMEKKYALDAEREEIERNVEMARDTLTGRPYSLEDPAGLDLDPERSLHKIDSTSETVFNFINDRPIVAGLNLAHRPHNARKGHKKGKRHQPSDQAPLDPMTDIKRRERFLLKERYAREQEL